MYPRSQSVQWQSHGINRWSGSRAQGLTLYTNIPMSLKLLVSEPLDTLKTYSTHYTLIQVTFLLKELYFPK